MFHLAAYVDAALDNVANSDIPALNDDVLSINNTHFVLSSPMDLVAAAAMSATITRAKVASPSMRQVASPYIRPVIAAVVPGNNPNIMLSYNTPYRIPANEEIQVQATSGVAMTEVFTALIWLSTGVVPWPVGNITPLRFTSTTAAVANVWTSVTITFEDTIPSGMYAMLFSEVHSTNAQAHRWIISNQMERPGFLSHTAGTQRTPYAMSLGQLGLLGRFRSNDLPRLQVLCNGADNSHTGYLHVVKVGSF